MRWEHWWFTAPLRLRSILRRRQVERELDEELQFHLEHKIEEGIAAGLSPKEARYRAMRAMDGLEQRKEEMRDMRRIGWLDADRCPSAYAIEQLVSIADRCHAQSGQEPAVESPRRRKLTHGQYDMRHAVDPDRGLSSCHGRP